MCLYRSIALSLVLTDFWVIGSWRTLVKYILVLEHFRDCLHWGIAYSLVMDFVIWQFMPDTYFLEIILHLRLTHFEGMHSYWGITTLLILTLRLHLLFMIAALMDRRVVDTLGSNFSTYLVRLRYPLSFVTHSYILHSAPLCLQSSCQSLTSFEPTFFIILHGFIPFFWSEEDVD